MSLSSRSRRVLKNALRSNSSGNELADMMGGLKQITEIRVPNAEKLKEISQIICPADASTKEISQLICPADASVKEISYLTCPAETGANYDGLYFVMQDADGSVAFWFDVDDSGTAEPAHGADRAIEINTVTTGMTAGQAGTAIYNAVIADSKFEAGSDDTAGNVQIQNVDYGNLTNAAAGTSNITAGVLSGGLSSNYDGKYFVMQDLDGSVAFWFDVDDSGTVEPAHGADRAIEINTINSEDSAGDVGTAIYNAVIADSKFEAGSDDTAGTILIQNVEYGNQVNAVAGDSPIVVSVNTPGASNLDGEYVILQDDAGSVAFWIDIDDSGTVEPAHGADRSVEINTIAASDSQGDVGTAIYNAIIADSEFEAGSDNLSGTILIQNAVAGARTNIVSSGVPLVVSINQEGADTALDGEYIILQDDAGSVAFWFDVEDSGTAEPSHGADRSVEVNTITYSMDGAQALSAIYAVIIADSKFEAGIDSGNGFCLVQSSVVGARSGQVSSNIDVIYVKDSVIGKEDGASISEKSSDILRIALARRSTEQYYLEIKAAFEAGSGTSLSVEALRSLKIMLADKKANVEIAALYA